MKKWVLYAWFFMHVWQLNLMLFKETIKYNDKVLKGNEIVQLMHVNATGIGLNFKRKKKEERKKKNNKNDSNNNQHNTMKKYLKG